MKRKFIKQVLAVIVLCAPASCTWDDYWFDDNYYSPGYHNYSDVDIYRNTNVNVSVNGHHDHPDHPKHPDHKPNIKPDRPNRPDHKPDNRPNRPDRPNRPSGRR